MSFNTDSLASTLHLMKNRNCDFIKSPENYKFIEETNRLLKNGLVLNLVNSIEDDVNVYYRRSTCQSSTQSSESEVNLQNLRKKGEILFFTFYQTQITDEEEKSLVKLIKLLSNLIVLPSNQSHAGIFTPSWQIPICSLLVIIQLTHVCALQQSTTLLSRESDYSHVRSISDLKVGNCLPSNKAGQKYDVIDADFKCEGVRGFACLAYAALRQPIVDVDAAPAVDVEFFLYNACITRAYSYIRLVMLPVLQTSYVQDRDTSIFYVQVLCELLTSLSNTFCSAHYRNQYGDSSEQSLLGEHDFPFVFFPPSQSFHNANRAFYVGNDFHPKINHEATFSTSKDNKEPILAVDSLEDVLLLFNALLVIRPHFANEFWNKTAAGLDLSFDKSFCGEGKMEPSSHPFVSKVMEASRHHPSLLLVTIHFCTSLAGGPLGVTAAQVYRLVKEARHPLLSWSHFFSVVDKIAQHLGATLSGGTTLISSGTGDSTLSTTGVGIFGTMRGGGATYAETIHAQQQMHLHQQCRHHRPQQLTSKDLDGLLGILELLTAVCVNGSVSQQVLEQYPLVSRLFSLLSCASLPASLKGTSLHLLAVLARLSASYAALIWEAIDFHKLLPFSTGITTPVVHSVSAPLFSNHPIAAGHRGGYNMSVTLNHGAPGALFGQQVGGSFAHTSPSVMVGEGGPFSSSSSHSHERGLRAELEESEARAGQYPVTDGFLSLLQALLLHGVPSAVVVGDGVNAISNGLQQPLTDASPSSVPCAGGVVRYLEYVIQDVLLKAHDRLYTPTDSPLAYGERFRQTAKALKVLTLVLQHYRINLLSDDILFRVQQTGKEGLNDEDLAALTARGLCDVLQDFCEGISFETGDALLTGQIGTNATARTEPVGVNVKADGHPKTAAFHLMVQLLNKSRLFDLLTNLMTECHTDALLHAYNTQCLFEIGQSVSIVQQLHSHSLNSHTYNLANHSMVPIAPPSLTDMRNRCSLSSRNSNDCDSIFWREKAVSGAVGLLYEVSLRERKFQILLHSAAKQLTIAHIEQGRTSVLPVAVEDFSVHLCNSTALSLVAHFLAHTDMTVPCVPSVPIMCVKLLEHVALNIPSYQLLASLSRPLSLQHLNVVSRELNLCDRMIESVVRALHVNNMTADIVSLCYDVIPMGGDPTPDTFSLSVESTFQGPVNIFSVANAPLPLGVAFDSPFFECGEDKSLEVVHKEYLRVANKHDSIRECVLRLLLSTLTPSSICLSHFLLGLTPSQQGNDDQGRSAACFEAVLDLLSPESYPLGATLLQLFPAQAVDCYELIYRLVASQAVRSVVVARLNSPHVNFLQVHGTLLMYMTHLSDEELLYLKCEKGTASAKRRMETIKSALYQSLAWLVKTTSAVLYTISSAVVANSAHTLGATSGGLRKVIATLLSLYYNSCTELAFSGERASEQSALSKLLDHCTLFPAAPLVSQSLSPTVRECITAASRHLELSKAGSGFGSLNRFHQQDTGTLELLSQSLQYVDITLLQQYLQERRDSIQRMALLTARSGRGHRLVVGAPPLSLSNEECIEGVHSAVMNNLYSQRVGAMAHCCMAWTQLVQISTVLPQPHLSCAAVPVAVLDGLFDVSYVFSQILVPLLNALLARPLVDSLVSETLARALLGLLSYVFAESNGVNNEAALNVQEFHFLLEGLLRLLITRRGDGTDDNSDCGLQHTSLLFRSLVSAALTTTLHSLTAAASIRVVSPSEKNKCPFEHVVGRRVSVLDIIVLEDYQQLAVVLLETHVTSLVDILATDILLTTSPLTRCTLLGTLSAVVSLLVPTAFFVGGSGLEEAYGSHTFLQVVQLLVNRGYLTGMLTFISGEGEHPNEGLLGSILTLCTHLATVRDGVEALVVCGIMDRLVTITDFLEPPALHSELLSFGAEAFCKRAEAVQALQNKLIPVLRLLTTLLVTFPTHKAVHMGATAFLRRNHKTVSQLLRLRYLTLTGLNMTELVAGIFAVLLSSKVLAEQGAFHLSEAELLISPVGSASEGGEGLLGGGNLADDFISDLCSLIGALGPDIVPLYFTADRCQAKDLAAFQSTWWSHIQPEASRPSELLAARTLYVASALATGMDSMDPTIPLDWTLFDHFKLSLGLSLAAHLSTCLRNLSTNAVFFSRKMTLSSVGSVSTSVMSSPKLLFLDMKLLCDLFNKTAGRVLSFQSGQETSEVPIIVENSEDSFVRSLVASSDWFSPPVGDDVPSGSFAVVNGTYVAQHLLPRLIFVSESLICVIHEMLLLGRGQFDRRSVAPIKVVLDTAEQFPSYSFLRQTSRGISECLYHFDS